MARPITTTVTTIAGVANGISLTQAVGPGVLALVLNGSLASGGKVVLDAPRRVVIHSNGNDSNKTFTITGTSGPAQGGAALVEVVTGGNGSDAVSTQDFASVSSIVASAATAGTVTAGTNGTASGPWVVWDGNVGDFQVGIAGIVLSGAPVWEVEYTYDDPFGTWLPAGVPFPRPFVHGVLQQENGNADGLFDSPVRASRLTLTAFGSVQLTQIQQGN